MTPDIVEQVRALGGHVQTLLEAVADELETGAADKEPGPGSFGDPLPLADLFGAADDRRVAVIGGGKPTWPDVEDVRSVGLSTREVVMNAAAAARALVDQEDDGDDGEDGDGVLDVRKPFLGSIEPGMVFLWQPNRQERRELVLVWSTAQPEDELHVGLRTVMRDPGHDVPGFDPVVTEWVPEDRFRRSVALVVGVQIHET